MQLFDNTLFPALVIMLIFGMNDVFVTTLTFILFKSFYKAMIASTRSIQFQCKSEYQKNLSSFLNIKNVIYNEFEGCLRLSFKIIF